MHGWRCRDLSGERVTDVACGEGIRIDLLPDRQTLSVPLAGVPAMRRLRPVAGGA